MTDTSLGGNGKIDLEKLERLLDKCPADELPEALQAFTEIDPDAVKLALKNRQKTDDKV